MIDWLTVRAWFDLDIRAGSVISVDADGAIEWQAQKRLPVRGSHDSAVTVRHFGYDGSIEFSGNPAKWLQGHNVWGTDDLAVVLVFLRRVLATLGHTPSPEEDRRLAEGMVVITRIDCTQSWCFGNQSRALSVIRTLAGLATFKHRGRGSSTEEGTVYYRQRSRRISCKVYAKGRELKAHALPRTLDQAEQIREHADGLVRIEFTLRSLWLKDRKLEILRNWGTVGATPRTLHAELMQGLNISEATITDTRSLEGLPARLQLAYDAWLAGKDLRALFPARTFYRYRAELLKHGIDLAVVQPSEPASNVIPLRVVLVGQPAQVPDWARNTPLYFDPRAA